MRGEGRGGEKTVPAIVTGRCSRGIVVELIEFTIWSFKAVDTPGQPVEGEEGEVGRSCHC